MIPYLGCEGARGMLEAFVDAELPVAEQVVLESHLRWCDTCRARVEDMRLIGAALRVGSPVSAIDDDRARAFAVMQSEVLARIDAERDQSLGVRSRALFADMRFLWPALGATLAVVVCLCAVTAVYGVARDEQPRSLAAMLSGLGSASPLDLAAPMPTPPPPAVAPALDLIPEGEAVFLLSAVVTGDSRVATYELLQSAREPSDEVTALLDALKYSRLAPARASEGTTVRIVWLLAHTTVRPSAPEDLDKSLTGGLARPVLRPARS